MEYVNKDEVVKTRSKKKYNCKRNKGEHEYLKPTHHSTPSIHYYYKTDRGILMSTVPHDKYKYLKTEVSVVIESVCKHCGHKCLSFMTDIIK